MTELIGKEGGTKGSRIGFEQLLVSMGHQSCGALTLWNYPNWMRNLVAQDINGEDRTNLIDMAALESKLTQMNASSCSSIFIDLV